MSLSASETDDRFYLTFILHVSCTLLIWNGIPARGGKYQHKRKAVSHISNTSDSMLSICSTFPNCMSRTTAIQVIISNQRR